jgi:hypothetical protein
MGNVSQQCLMLSMTGGRTGAFALGSWSRTFSSASKQAAEHAREKLSQDEDNDKADRQRQRSEASKDIAQMCKFEKGR